MAELLAGGWEPGSGPDSAGLLGAHLRGARLGRHTPGRAGGVIGGGYKERGGEGWEVAEVSLKDNNKHAWKAREGLSSSGRSIV